MFNIAYMRFPPKSMENFYKDKNIRFNKILKEWFSLLRILIEHNVTIEVLEPLEHYPDSVYMQDVALIINDKALLANFTDEWRRGEEKYILPVLKGTNIFKSKYRFEGGDILLTETLGFVGTYRTSPKIIHILKRIFPELEFLIVRKKYPNKCYHLMSCASYIGKNTILTIKEYEKLFKRFSYETITVNEPNAVYLPDGYIVGAPSTAKILSLEYGYKVVPLKFEENKKADASLTCPILAVYRIT